MKLNEVVEDVRLRYATKIPELLRQDNWPNKGLLSGGILMISICLLLLELLRMKQRIHGDGLRSYFLKTLDKANGVSSPTNKR